jgi:hypothetical protein
MTEPMSGIAPVASRSGAIHAGLSAIAGDAIVTTSVPGTYSTLGVASSPAAGGGVFASVLASAAAVDGLASSGAVSTTVGTGDSASGTWTIPWLEGTAPTQAAGASAARAGSATGILPTTPGAAAFDPFRVVSPVKGRISQDYGPTSSVYSTSKTVNGVYYPHFHDGIDIAAPIGRAVKAIAAGKVIFAGTYPDGARVVRIKHADGSISLYAHLGHGLDVKKGDKVAAGQQIGVVGMTGHTTGPHLHLELLVNGHDADPERVLKAGRLPGAKSGAIDTSVLGATSKASVSSAVLATFDRVASTIPYAAEIRDAAIRAGIDPLLLASLVKAESSFHRKSVSRCGAMGLCQLMPATAKALGVTDPFDATQNLRAGARYLARNLHIYGRVDVALAAYQAGKGAVARAGGIPDSPTTRHYIARILHTWAGYQEAAK